MNSTHVYTHIKVKCWAWDIIVEMNNACTIGTLFIPIHLLNKLSKTRCMNGVTNLLRGKYQATQQKTTDVTVSSTWSTAIEGRSGIDQPWLTNPKEPNVSGQDVRRWFSMGITACNWLSFGQTFQLLFCSWFQAFWTHRCHSFLKDVPIFLLVSSLSPLIRI